MFTRLPAAVRNLLVALVVIVTMMIVRGYFDSDPLDLPPHEDPAPPAIRVARETKPTIVESNDDWLDSTGPSQLSTPNLDRPILDRPRIELRLDADGGENLRTNRLRPSDGV